MSLDLWDPLNYCIAQNQQEWNDHDPLLCDQPPVAILFRPEGIEMEPAHYWELNGTPGCKAHLEALVEKWQLEKNKYQSPYYFIRIQDFRDSMLTEVPS